MIPSIPESFSITILLVFSITFVFTILKLQDLVETWIIYESISCFDKNAADFFLTEKNIYG